MTNSKTITHLQRVITLMQQGAAALERRDAPGVEACGRALMATLKELQNTVDADMARAVDHGAESTVPLAELMREALFLVEANHRNVGQWRRQTQDALRMIDNGSRAVMGYADALRARREERFDVSA